MAERLQVNPTRMELTRLKKKLATATRGHKLLKDKRDELMRQFLDRVRENMALRQKVEQGLKAANQEFMLARASMQDAALNTALLAPKQRVSLECEVENVMSVEVPKFTFHTRTPSRGICSPMALPSPPRTWTGPSRHWQRCSPPCWSLPKKRKPAS